MNRRSLPSDPLMLLRATTDDAPPEAAAARLTTRLSRVMSGSAGSALGAGPSALAATPSSGWRALAGRFLRWSAAPLGVGIVIGASGHALLAGAARHPQPAPSGALVTSTPAV